MVPAVPVGDVLLIVAAVLLAAGAAGSLVPTVPGGLLSLVGVAGYWWATGFAGDAAAFVAVGGVLALLAVTVDVLGGPLAAGAAGTTKRTAAAAGVVGLLLALVTGPLGILAGIAATVYAAERRRGTERRESLLVAARTLAGLLVTNGVQFVLTSFILVGFLAVVLL